MKTNKATFVTEVKVVDPDTGNEIEVEIWKHQNGGMFGMDSSYLDQCSDPDFPTIVDPFSENWKAPDLVDLRMPE
jgi:hypothetical protein